MMTRWVLGGFRGFGLVGLHGAELIRAALSTRRIGPALLHHTATLWRNCLGPVVFAVLPFGMVIAVQGMKVFDLFGAHRMLSGLLALVVVRELAPVIASVLVAAQGGSQVGAELGTMRTQEELDATLVMGEDPIGVHVLPRFLAIVLVCPVLTLLGTLAGIFGGWFVAVVLRGQANGVFLYQLDMLVGSWDIIATLIKSTVFGITVGLIATSAGYHASGGAEGVGRAVNATVVRSVLFILMLNYILSSLLYGGLVT